MRLSKEVREAMSLLDPGWELEGRNGSGHLKLRHSCGAQLVIANSPGDTRRFRGNVLRDAKRAIRERTSRETTAS